MFGVERVSSTQVSFSGGAFLGQDQQRSARQVLVLTAYGH